MALDEMVRQEIGIKLFNAKKNAKAIPTISKSFSDINYEDAYGIQKYMLREYKKAGYVRSGRKIGLTSKAMREMVNINEPDYGSIFYNDFFLNGATLRFSDYIIPRIEVEFAYKLKKDLNKPKVTKEDVLDATEYIVCAFELIDNRADMTDIKVHDSIADNAAFAAYTLGDIPIYPNDADMRKVGIVVYKNGKQECVSSGAAVMGDSTNAVVWLAEKMYELNDPLMAGELILAGSVVAAMFVKPGDYFRADFGKFGDVSVFFE